MDDTRRQYRFNECKNCGKFKQFNEFIDYRAVDYPHFEQKFVSPR
jgi:hypothetical protein